MTKRRQQRWSEQRRCQHPGCDFVITNYYTDYQQFIDAVKHGAKRPFYCGKHKKEHEHDTAGDYSI